MDADRLAEAQTAAAMPFSTKGATIEWQQRPVTVEFSARIPAEYSARLAAEAVRCDQNPSQLIVDLVAEALEAREETGDFVVSANDLRKLVAKAQLTDNERET